LQNLAQLQGTAVNIESGEEPGKCIHEYRTEGFEHLIQSNEPWYLYPDNTLRNYDTVDATPLFLLAFYELYTLTGDFMFMESHLDHIEAALWWIIDYGDGNDDGLLDYSFHPKRKFGGLKTQSWMDSTESVFFEDSSERPAYPIAPVEVQAYAFGALKNFADFFQTREPQFSKRLLFRARELKEKFNRAFIKPLGRSIAVAYAIDGTGERLWSTRSSIAHTLWASYRGGNIPESIVDEEHIPGIVRRLMARDIFVPGAGIRTLSASSKRYDPVSYHNGSIWPHDTAIVAEGFETFGYVGEAHSLRTGLLQAYKHFNTPIELYAYDEGFKEYEGVNGGRACRVQAWSAASLLTTLQALEL
jgi:glycogen debranching enzyme